MILLNRLHLLLLFVFLFLTSSYGAVFEDDYVDFMKPSLNERNLTSYCENVCEDTTYPNCVSDCISTDSYCFVIEDTNLGEGNPNYILVFEEELRSVKGTGFEVPICVISQDSINNEYRSETSITKGEILIYNQLTNDFSLQVAKEYNSLSNTLKFLDSEENERNAIIYGIESILAIIVNIVYVLAIFVILGYGTLVSYSDLRKLSLNSNKSQFKLFKIAFIESLKDYWMLLLSISLVIMLINIGLNMYL